MTIQLKIIRPKECDDMSSLKNQIILKIKIWLSSMYSNQIKGNLRESNTSFNAIMHIFHERFIETIFIFSIRPIQAWLLFKDNQFIGDFMVFNLNLVNPIKLIEINFFFKKKTRFNY